MKIPCSVIKDLLPLYFEGIVSEETKTYIDEHLAGCESCKKELEQIGRTDVIVPDSSIAPLKKIKSALRREKAVAVGLSVVLTLLFTFLCVRLLYTPRALPYNQAMFSFAADKDNAVTVTLNQPASAWYVDRGYSQELGGEVYFVSVWTDYITEWDKSHLYTNSFVLNEHNEPVASVYYCPNDGTENILIYGKDAADGGGSITLPRLALAYYVAAAAIVAILLGIATVILRKNRMTKYLLLRISYLPGAYILAHLLVKGMQAETYTLAHDLCAIFVITIPVYALCVLIERIFSKEPLPWAK